MFVITCLVCALSSTVFARRSPLADVVEELFIHGSEAGRYSNNVLEDAMLDAPGLIAKYGYPIEVHNIITEDGYILEVHRIPHGRDQNASPNVTKPAVLVQHGFIGSSGQFAAMGPGNGLAYVLAEEGYDVWLGNTRGNYYSRRHVTLDPDSPLTRDQFWRFSWDEIGYRDIPAMIDYILATTGKSRMHYIGHSQGTTVFFVMGSLRPEYNDKIISMHAYAPVAFLEFAESLLFSTLGLFPNIIETLAEIYGINELFVRNDFTSWVTRTFCADGILTQNICSNIMFAVSGRNEELHNATMMPVKLGHLGGATLRLALHYGQLAHHDGFRRYDHGRLINWRSYGSFTPTDYNLSLVTAPIFLHYTTNDPLAHVNDVEKLYLRLGGPVEKLRVPHPYFNHMDFTWGIGVKELLYDKTISIMRDLGIPGPQNVLTPYLNLLINLNLRTADIKPAISKRAKSTQYRDGHTIAV